MKIQLAKLLMLLLILGMVVTVFTACSSAGDGREQTTGGSESASDGETEAVEESFRIVEGGTAYFNIVAPEDATDGEEEAFMELRSAIAEMTGVSLDFKDDWIRKGETHDPDAYEILIGQTNYDETQEVLNDTSYGSYTIKVVGRKLVVTSWSEEGIVKGAKALVKILQESLKGQDLVVNTASLYASKVVDRSLDSIPVVPNLRIDHIYDANGTSELIYKNATLDHFNAYVEKLEKDGYVKYAENARGQVHSAIFTDQEDYTYNIVLEGAYEELCVLIDPYSKKTLPPKEASYTKICETQFAQVGVEYKYSGSAPQNGMCYVWRLEDGRFIILDGGFNYVLGATNLYKTLSEMAVDPDNIVIASWVISHFHGDHVGTLVKFVQNYLYEVKIESLLFNLPTLEQSKMAEMNWNSWNTIATVLLPANPRLAVYKAHPGQVYHFANAELEILYTLEMYAPKDLTYYNTCTIVVDFKFGDFNMMMLGDCSEDANLILCNNYGDALESEVVQVAHHGYQGGTTAFYKHINPIYVFWPAGAKWYSTCENNVADGSDSNRNEYFFLENTRIKTIYVAKATVVLLTIEEDKGFLDCNIYSSVTDFVNRK